MTTRDLFVCYAGQIRSKMAAEIAIRLTEERGVRDYTAENVGIVELLFLPDTRLLYKLNEYSRIFVMEDEFKEWLMQRVEVQRDKIINLDVTGELERSREDVRMELEEKLKPFFENE